MVVCLAIGGCSTAGSSSGAASGAGNYWLIKVSDGYGNIYNYPAGDQPSQTVQSAYLGPTTAAADQNAAAAAKRLGIVHLDTGKY